MTGIVDSSANTVVEYTYDAWGKLLSTTGSLAGTIGKINPFLYRGYYLDSETGLYYLNSRYYDLQTGRFLNADDTSVLQLDQNSLSVYNLYTYGDNNPIMNIDPSGYWKISIKTTIAGYILDFAITVFLPYIFTAFKATKLASWARASRFFRGVYDRTISSLSKGIYKSMNFILYKIMGKVANAATKSFTLARINTWVGNILNFSIGYGVAWLINRFDKDGPSGYIRY